MILAKYLIKSYILPAILSMCVEALMFSVFGSLPSIVIFIFAQFYIVSVTLFIGVFNVSSFLQVALITNQQ